MNLMSCSKQQAKLAFLQWRGWVIKSRAATIIKRAWQLHFYERIRLKVIQILSEANLYKEHNSSRLTEYEKAGLFNKQKGANKPAFNQAFGIAIEKILSLGAGFEWCGARNTFDIASATTVYEIKSRHDTCKQSHMIVEMLQKFEASKNYDKAFCLMIVTDKNNLSRNVALHEIKQLKGFKNCVDYNAETNRYISGDFVYSHCFYSHGQMIKDTIKSQLSLLRRNWDFVQN